MSRNIFSCLDSDNESENSTNIKTKKTNKTNNVIDKYNSNHKINNERIINSDNSKTFFETFNTNFTEKLENNMEESNSSNPFENQVNRKTLKKNIKNEKTQQILNQIDFLNVPEDYDITNLKVNNFFQVYAHFNGDKWNRANYLSVTRLNNWKDLIGFINALGLNYSKYSMNNFDTFVMKNTISPMWEDDKNRSGAKMSIKISSQVDALEIFKYLLINIFNDSLLCYTDKTVDKTNAITIGSRLDNDVRSFYIKIWFANIFSFDSKNLLNPQINQKLDNHGYSIKFSKIKPEF